ncbi:hypothetical protein SNE26_21515 [Mucilaginibacter sp. cycad4]|uniref:hypothetical protein n=1 Tax=Mucilaginibacter sp. cycad4 TaxID=3342096 RepID=UPI002AABD04F|nr:hypothetical protein [Mucilaginibacter gossypii]WPU98602.1 hypothetical protein SNE26_21515 [Mucilaginibacter gossypii]
MTENEKAKNKIKSKIGIWHHVNESTYILVFNLAKERFEDILGESESITNKAIKIETGLLAFIGFFVGYFFTNQNLIVNHVALISWSGIPVFLEVTLLAFLIFPKKVKNRGLPPEVSLVENIDSPEDKKNQRQLVYYNCIVALQENIDFMLVKNENRAKIYTIALSLFLLLVIYIPALTIFLISNHS